MATRSSGNSIRICCAVNPRWYCVCWATRTWRTWATTVIRWRWQSGRGPRRILQPPSATTPSSTASESTSNSRSATTARPPSSDATAGTTARRRATPTPRWTAPSAWAGNSPVSAGAGPTTVWRSRSCRTIWQRRTATIWQRVGWDSFWATANSATGRSGSSKPTTPIRSPDRSPCRWTTSLSPTPATIRTAARSPCSPCGGIWNSEWEGCFPKRSGGGGALISQRLPVALIDLVGEADKEDLLRQRVGVQPLAHLGDGNRRGALDRKAIDAGADGREGHRLATVLFRKGQTVPVTVRQQFFLMGLSAAPNGADRVDDMSGRQFIAAGDLRLTGLASVQFEALERQFRSGSPMNGPIDPSAAEQRGVRRIDDGVHLQLRYVALYDFDSRCHPDLLFTSVRC